MRIGLANVVVCQLTARNSAYLSSRRSGSGRATLTRGTISSTLLWISWMPPLSIQPSTSSRTSCLTCSDRSGRMPRIRLSKAA